MRKVPFRLLLVVGAILIPLLPQDALACQCSGLPTPFQAYEKATAVFVGKVVRVSDATGGELSEDELSEVKRIEIGERTALSFRFAVQERLKGPKETELTVSTSINMCQFGFTKGDTYLVYAFATDDPKQGLVTHLFCGRTDGMQTGRDDVIFLRGLLKGEREPRIYGSVQLREANDYSGSTFLEGIKIVATRGRRRFTTVTDKDGLYRFNNLPNGKYKVLPELPKGYELDWFHVEEITLTNGNPNDSLFNMDMRYVTGRSAFSEFTLKPETSTGKKQK